MAIYQELEIDQGSTFRYQIDLTLNSTQTPYDLTGYTMKSEIRKNHKSLTVAAAFTCAFQAGNPVLGKILLSLTDEQTAAITPGRYLFDVLITASTGETYRAVEGLVEITPSVTQL